MTTPDALYANILSYRAILSTETDADSPDNETTYGTVRHCLESLLLSLSGKVKTLTLTSDPADTPDGIATDTGAGMTASQYVGFLAIVLDGDGIGNIFYIEANATTTITCYTDLNGDSGGINPNLYSAGIRSGDQIGIFYHFLTPNHNHNGKNSAPATVADGQISRVKLKTAGGSGSGTSASNARSVISMQDYCFFPNTYTQTRRHVLGGYSSTGGGYVGRFSFDNDTGSADNYSFQYRYVTSSDKPFIYTAMSKDGDVLAVWMCDDPPPDLWGFDELPEGYKDWPILFDSKQWKKTDRNVVCFNEDADKIKEINDKAAKDKIFTFELLNDDYVYDEDNHLFKPKNLLSV